MLFRESSQRVVLNLTREFQAGNGIAYFGSISESTEQPTKYKSLRSSSKR